MLYCSPGKCLCLLFALSQNTARQTVKDRVRLSPSKTDGREHLNFFGVNYPLYSSGTLSKWYLCGTEKLNDMRSISESCSQVLTALFVIIVAFRFPCSCTAIWSGRSLASVK